ncbi:MAG: hypothetical protein ABSG18_23475 [Steroidobacteraceae bacterium]|jgi:hypothetical protein
MRPDIRRFAIGFFLTLLLAVSGQPAAAACSDWLREVALPKYGCSPQAIEDICAGRRPVPTNGTCETPAQPIIDTAGPPYQQFQSLVAASGISLQLHPTYTQQYFEKRAQLYCGLLGANEIVKLTTEITFPPVVNFTETTADRSRLEVAIMRVGTASYCPQSANLERQWEATNIR